jgi:hypothetical protein
MAVVFRALSSELCHCLTFWMDASVSEELAFSMGWTPLSMTVENEGSKFL